jgi:chromosome segregation ATPase
MGYLISEMLPCLLLAGLIGIILGWLLRKCKKRDLSYEDVSQKVIEDNMVRPRLKSEGLMDKTEPKIDPLEEEIVQLRLKLSSAELEAKTAGMKLSALESDYDAKLKTMQGALSEQGAKGESLALKQSNDSISSDVSNHKQAIQTLKSELKDAKRYKKELEDSLNTSKTELQTLQNKLSDAESLAKSFDIEKKRLLDEVASLKSSLEDKERSWTQKLLVVEQECDNKLEKLRIESKDQEHSLQALKSGESERSNIEKELIALKDELERAKTKITTSQMKYKVMLNDYTSKLENADEEIEKLKAEIESLSKVTKALSETKKSSVDENHHDRKKSSLKHHKHTKRLKKK